VLKKKKNKKKKKKKKKRRRTRRRRKMNKKRKHVHNYHHKRAVRKVSSHFEHLEIRSHSHDVAWQPVRGDLTVHL
jgi:hypothetical protein